MRAAPIVVALLAGCASHERPAAEPEPTPREQLARTLALELPDCAGPDRPAGGRAVWISLGAIHVLMACTAHLFWATAFGAVRHMVARPSSRRVLDVIAGVALLALGVWLLASR